MLDPEILSKIPSGSISTNQGMSVTAELAAYHQAQGTVESIFNRKIPVLPLTAFTDAIDPRVDGQSSSISHEEVQAAGRRGQEFIAPVISEYALQTASLFTPEEDVRNLIGNLTQSEPEHDLALLEELETYKESEGRNITLGGFYQYLEKMKNISLKNAQNDNKKQVVWHKLATWYDRLAGVLAKKMGFDREPYI